MYGDDKSVIIVTPPFVSLDYPSLGPSLLVSQCQSKKLESAVLYANLIFASEIGYSLYQQILLISFEKMWMLGDMIFRNLAFPNDSFRTSFTDYISKCLNHSGQMAITMEDVLFCQDKAVDFIDKTVKIILESKPKIVGFSSMFEQNLACIALAKRLKALYPQVVTVFGGANAVTPMGKAIQSTTDVFDYVFSGESDIEFPDFCKRYIEKNQLPRNKIIECAPIFEMDSLEPPVFNDYFEQLNVYLPCEKDLYSLPKYLHFETSRGCWWGTKSHCTFCGLNDLELRYRSKSSDRTLKEIIFLLDKYQITQLRAVDNIMPYQFKNNVLPQLAALPLTLDLFYEVKSNLKPEILDLFVLAGIHKIQPGIESFSSYILKLIKKGNSGINNLRFLRDCLSRRIDTAWNILTAIPGEKQTDYQEMLTLIPLIEHFQPPEHCGNIHIDRFSLYHADPEIYGINKLRPLSVYFDLYPYDALIKDIGYYFEGDYMTDFNKNKKLQSAFFREIHNWKQKWTEGNPPVLEKIALAPDLFLIRDTRECAVEKNYFISDGQNKLLNQLNTPIPCHHVSKDGMAQINELYKRGFIIKFENYYMNIVTDPSIGQNLRKQKWKT